ncbi:MAG: DNA/RNA non-specific endonuclease [Clostridia bacterium]|nr:DNA/RNA non-specific endonuclease [Clostridia bacterium]
MGKRGSALTKVVLAIIIFFLAGIGFGFNPEAEVFIDSSKIQIENNNEEKNNSSSNNEVENVQKENLYQANLSLEHIPEYTQEPYVIINNNIPYFTEAEMTTNSYEFFSELDELKRCGVVHASIGKDLMPTEEREYIGYIKPTGWQVSKYDGIDGAYLYNRCHLIGFQLTGENANAKNLITGTRYMNVQGMLPFENEVANYVKTTDNHVMYRVTPIYDGDNLLASGVLMEAKSVEDNGEGVMFNVYCYNVQPGIEIDYATGTNYKTESEDISSNENGEKQDYVLNVNSRKFHLPDCDGVNQMSEKNKQNFNGYKNDLLSQGYEPCGICKP